MNRICRFAVAALMLGLLFGSSAALGRGEKIIPQLADGAGAIRTKIDINNLSSNVSISKVKIFFFLQDGTPWMVTTNLGTFTELRLDIGRNQTVRIETLAQSALVTAGYAVIRNTEDNATNTHDFQIAVSVFYEILNGANVVDAISVPVEAPTRRWVFPVEINNIAGLYTGFAIVNISDEPNPVNFQLWTAFPTSVADASDGGSIDFTLNPNEQQARFLNQQQLFPEIDDFRGVLVGTAEKPVAVLGLLQTSTPSGIQYSTLAARPTDALHSESTLYLPQAASLDADVPLVPYVTLDNNGSHDLLFDVVSANVRNFIAQNGATFSVLGIKTLTELNNLTVEDLKNLPYSPASIGMSDFSGNLVAGFTIAIRTSQGRFAKIRIAKVVTEGPVRDVVLQLYVYR